MSNYSNRVHIVPTTLDHEQVGFLFDEIAADRVYILENKDPVGLSEGVKKLPKKRIREVVKSRTRCFENEEVIETETDFYHYPKALTDCYEIIYKESTNGNEIIINLAGGTKPVAIALAFASSLANAGQLFYVANSYKEPNTEDDDDGGEPVAAGPYSEIFSSGPLAPLNIKNLIPKEQGKQKLLKGLNNINSPAGVTDILISLEVVEETPPEDEDQKNNRSRIIQRHHGYARNLVEDGLLEKEDSTYKLTYTGELIADLVEIMMAYD
jgi:hypothetical protein